LETVNGNQGETSTISSALDNGPRLPGMTALHWLRTENDGNHSGDWTACKQTLSYDVSACSCATMTIDVKVLGHNLGGSGWTPTEYEFPVTVVVYYTDATGAPKYWQYGWYKWIDGATGPNPNHKSVAGGTGVVTGLQVADSVWIMNSFDLMTELANPRTIDSIRVGGSGWDFEGMADNIQLLVCTPSCEYYKPTYVDYAPKGMPDFDQKQNNWRNPQDPQQRWTHCGPVALANCLWWFDSKFETSTTPPPTIVDNYPLVQSYATMGPPWDDHDALNVMPFVDSLALYCGTNIALPFPLLSGTAMINMAAGVSNWLNKTGLSSKYTVNLVQYPPYQLLYDQVHESQDVILLLGFYGFDPTGLSCCRLGGHYVTIAGVCSAEQAICISDPWFDMNEGEPPAGSAHLSSVHNDARFVSGPHGTVHHDKYAVTPPMAPCPLPGAAMLSTYPVGTADIVNFEFQNPFDPGVQHCPYQGGPIYTVIEGALVICPICIPGPAYGDSTKTDACLTICPKSDAVFRVTEKDSCGNLICDLNGTWLDFSQCPAVPCSGWEPAWPRVFPDSCRDGVHYFNVDAGLLGCVNCQVGLIINGQLWRAIPAYFFDVNGDLCVTPNDFVPGVCNDYDCNGIVDNADLAIFTQHLGHCCPTCDCKPGDANFDHVVDISDVVYLIAYIFSGGSAPKPYAKCSGDANKDCSVDISDVVYLIAYIFSGGNPPCTCQQWLTKCGPPLRK